MRLCGQRSSTHVCLDYPFLVSELFLKLNVRKTKRASAGIVLDLILPKCCAVTVSSNNFYIHIRVLLYLTKPLTTECGSIVHYFQEVLIYNV